MKQFIIKEKFTGYANIIIRAETEEEAIKLYDRGYYKDQDTFYLGRKYDHQFLSIEESQPLKCNPIEYSIIMNREKGLNIDVTRGQYMMLYNIMCEHNQMVNPEANPNFDLQTFDNLFQAITMAKETYL